MNKRLAEGPPSIEQNDMANSAVRCPRFAERRGVVLGRSRHNNSIRILFDGYKYLESLHRDYIEQIPLAENKS